MLSVGSLFSGIGGIDLGLERAGMKVLWQCEIDPYCRKVLAKHWPDVRCYEDVRELDETTPKVDLICGGFPCQPVSKAGKRQAEADLRWLWPEFARVIGLLRPRYVLVENVPGLLTKGMGFVLGSLSTLRYDAEWDCVSAAAFGAPHIRDRVFIIAYPVGTTLRQESLGFGRSGDPPFVGTDGKDGDVADTSSPRCGERRRQEGRALRDETRGPQSERRSWWAVEPGVGRVADGIPSRVHRLRGLGNAVVPQVAEYVGRLIMEDAERGKA